MPEARFNINPARCRDDLQAVTQLFKAYAASLNIDLAYQNFDDELSSLPGRYSPPTGELLLARDQSGAAIGCVALRPSEGTACEMKRLFVSPEGRGLGLGTALIEAIMVAARELGYQEMRLDTLPTMEQAVSLYRRLGFTETPPYFETPIEGNIFMKKSLTD